MVARQFLLVCRHTRTLDRVKELICCQCTTFASNVLSQYSPWTPWSSINLLVCALRTRHVYADKSFGITRLPELNISVIRMHQPPYAPGYALESQRTKRSSKPLLFTPNTNFYVPIGRAFLRPFQVFCSRNFGNEQMSRKWRTFPIYLFGFKQTRVQESYEA